MGGLRAYGAGSQFVLNLPLPETAAQDEPQLRSQVDGGRLQGFKILAAEDVALNRIVLEDILTQEGAQVRFAENGQQVLDCLEEIGYYEFDMILMDIQMPVMDGYQATRLILDNFSELAIIGLTAHAMPEERQRCLDAGMRDRVTKPIDAESLVRTILQHIPAKITLDNRNEVKPVSDLEPEYQDPPETGRALDAANLIDWSAMLQRYDGRQTFIKKLISSILNGGHQENLQKLRDLAQQQDYAAIKIIAHNIRGMAGVFAAQSLMDQAQHTELAAKNQQQQTIILAAQLADSLQCLLTELQTYLESHE